MLDYTSIYLHMHYLKQLCNSLLIINKYVYSCVLALEMGVILWTIHSN